LTTLNVTMTEKDILKDFLYVKMSCKRYISSIKYLSSFSFFVVHKPIF